MRLKQYITGLCLLMLCTLHSPAAGENAANWGNAAPAPSQPSAIMPGQQAFIVLPNGTRTPAVVRPEGTLVLPDGTAITNPDATVILEDGRQLTLEELRRQLPPATQTAPDAAIATPETVTPDVVTPVLPEKTAPDVVTPHVTPETVTPNTALPATPEKPLPDVVTPNGTQPNVVVPDSTPATPAQDSRLHLWQMMPLTEVPDAKKEQPAPEKKPDVKPEKPVQEKKPDVKPEKKPEKKPDVKPEKKPDVKPAPKEEKKPEVKEPKPEKKPEVKPEKTPRAKPGEELKIPPEAVKTGNLDFLEGCWQGTRPEYYSKRTVKECFCFGAHGGSGKRRVLDPKGGRQCIGATKARLDGNGVLHVTSEGASCDDGQRWGASQMTCRGNGQKTPCSWIFTDTNGGRQAYEIPFIRVESCGRR